jgi:predicted nucleotidyltransferase
MAEKTFFSLALAILQNPIADFGCIVPFGRAPIHANITSKEKAMIAAADPILTRFRSALDETYGERIERVVLFGSHARGEARADSDYDVAVFLKDLDSFGTEAGRIAAIETDILYDTGAVINAIPFGAGAYRERTGLMQELRRDGIDL